MFPFDVVTGRSRMVSDSGGVTYLSESFEMIRLCVMQYSFGFTNVESITVLATGFVDKLRFLQVVETISVRKERVNCASVLKSNPEVDENIKRIDTYSHFY